MRLHKVHHADPDFDFTTTFRFHPLEYLIASPISIAVIFILGTPPSGIFLYEMLMVTTSFISHTNIKVPIRLEAYLNKVIITPYLHRLHHSAKQVATDSNYGSLFPFWDRKLGTYTAPDFLDQKTMRLGLDEYQDEKHLGLFAMLMMPFVPTSTLPEIKDKIENEK